MARRKRVEEHINHDRWLISYADFITLLFAFFVVMYSISSVNEGKYRVLSDTLESVFSNPKKSLDPIQIGEISRSPNNDDEDTLTPSQGEAIYIIPPPTATVEVEVYTPPKVDQETIDTINNISKQLNDTFEQMISDGDVSIKQGEDWLELEMKSNVLFYSGEARLGKEAVPIIGKVAKILSNSGNPIQVEGFTDNNPINTPRFPSNWELSAARAASVVHLLERYGLTPNRMSAIGYGEFQPIADNSTIEGQQQNRRVVLVVLGNKHSRRSLDRSAQTSTISTQNQQDTRLQTVPSTSITPSPTESQVRTTP
ncbi:MAG: flagellar motor protein MotD [Gammaproteobacteria bacterium]|nr:MAG: flagellar motor protein MotD [Gammaproteobacteria bacterium]